jgi:RNA polymerase primary sigma factor
VGEFDIDEYLKKIGRVELLAIEEEKILAERIAKGDERAVEALVDANARFVVALAAQYKNKGLSLEELIAIGNGAMAKAAATFDAASIEPFVKYAVPFVRQALEERTGG